MKVPFNDLYTHNRSMHQEIQDAIASVIESSAFVDGPAIGEFEKRFSSFCGGEVAAVSNGTDALMLALLSLDLKPGDEVIVPAQSFIATIEPLFFLGLKPIFVDCCSETYNIDPQKVETAITSRTKAIIAVHLYGCPADIKALRQIATRYDLKIIEDSAQGHCAEIDGVRAGSLGDIATFSFYPGKNLGAFGDAGAVVSKNQEWIKNVRVLRNHGRQKGAKYEHSAIGFNCRMDTIQAAVLTVKLDRLEEWTDRRRKIAAQYTNHLKDIVKTPIETKGVRHVYHLYVIEVPRREDFIANMRELGVQTGIHYPIPMHLHQPVVNALGDKRGFFPNAERSAEHIVSLPIYPEMTEQQIEYVIEATKRSL